MLEGAQAGRPADHPFSARTGSLPWNDTAKSKNRASAKAQVHGETPLGRLNREASVLVTFESLYGTTGRERHDALMDLPFGVNSDRDVTLA